MTGTLNNQVTGTGDAVDANGAFHVSASGQTIVTSDVSDSGFSTNTSNPGAPGDLGTSGDPTPLNLLIGGTGTSGSPVSLPILSPIFSPFSGITGFLGGPGPIYSGIPISSNANPISLDSGRPVSGGFAGGMVGEGEGCCPAPVEIDPCGEPLIEQAPLEQVVDPCCEEIVNPYGETTPLPMTQIVDPNGNVILVPQQGMVTDQEGVEITAAEEVAPDGVDEQNSTNVLDISKLDPAHQKRDSFLKRFHNWLSV